MSLQVRHSTGMGKFGEGNAPSRNTHVQRCFSIIRLKQGGHSRDEAPLLLESVPYDIPLPFNVADEVSCRAGTIKCSRCRASFAPISSAFTEPKLVPPLRANQSRH